MIKMGSFRSYVGLEEYEMKAPRQSLTHPPTLLQPNLLPGEVIVAEAINVLKFTAITKKNGISGSVFVTNARIIFVSNSNAETYAPGELSLKQNEESFFLLGIQSLVYYEDPGKTGVAGRMVSGGGKGKKKIKFHTHNFTDREPFGGSGGTDFLSPGGETLYLSGSGIAAPGASRIQELVLISSGFQTLRLSFKFSLLDHGLKITNALIHWCSPGKSIEKLFYIDYVRNLEFGGLKGMGNQHQLNSGGISLSLAVNPIPNFSIPGDWLREIKTSGTKGYRATNVNTNWELTQSLTETIIVPTYETFSDVKLQALAEKLKGNRPPFWSWGDPRGSAILRMSKLHNEADCSAENAFYEGLRSSHLKRRRPHLYDLDVLLPTKEIRTAQSKLYELSCPESYSRFLEIEPKFLSYLENTRWLNWCSKTLELSYKITEILLQHPGDVVILQENESRDSSCLISSLSQLILQPRFRTIPGYFALIEKEWIGAGHGWHSNYSHSSPWFLLFLDSTFQLLTQNPFEFEFNSVLLEEIWDSTADSTVGTFLFDSPFQRKTWERRKDLTAWNKIIAKHSSYQSQAEEIGNFSFGAGPSNSSLHYRSSPSHLHSYPTTPQFPKTLLNPFYKLKSLLAVDPPEPLGLGLPRNLPPPLCVHWSIADLEFWSGLYLDRTAEPLNPSSFNSKLKVPSKFSPLSPAKGKRGSSTTTPSPSPSPEHYKNHQVHGQETTLSKFPFSSLHIPSGPSTLYELNIVESILETLSTTTKYKAQAPPIPSRPPKTPGTGASVSVPKPKIQQFPNTFSI